MAIGQYTYKKHPGSDTKLGWTRVFAIRVPQVNPKRVPKALDQHPQCQYVILHREAGEEVSQGCNCSAVWENRSG